MIIVVSVEGKRMAEKSVKMVKKSKVEFYVKIIVALLLYIFAVGLVIIDCYYGLNLKTEYVMLIIGSEISVASAILIDALTSGRDIIKYEQSQGLKVKKVIIESSEE